MATKATQPKDKADRTDMVGRMDRSDPAGRVAQTGQSASDPCVAPIDRNAPAGTRNSLGAKSDCNGRPTTDDSVVEAKDELDPSIPPPMPEPRSGSR